MGTEHPNLEARTVAHLLWDSRQFSTAKDTAFFALRGKNHDGHRYLEALYQKGVRIFVVEEIPEAAFADALFLKVADSIEALQELGKAIRKDFKGELIGLTGSNGKTITKEWLWRLLDGPQKAFRNPKSYNSQIGVPLSLWEMEEDVEIAILEAGISQPGEMTKLAAILKPKWGIFTNIGSAHGENFPNTEAKIAEKFKLFAEAEHLVYPADDRLLAAELPKLAANSPLKLQPWSYHKGQASTWINVLDQRTDAVDLEIHYSAETYLFHLPFGDAASLENVLNALVLALTMGVPYLHLQEQVQLLAPVEMRLEMKRGREQSVLINDAYNSDLESLRLALHFLEAHGRDRSKVLVLSDLLQISLQGASLYAKVVDIIGRFQLEKIIAIGPQLKQFGLAELPVDHYPDTESFLAAIAHYSWRDKAILLKGSRPFQFERIDRRLSLKRHQTVLEVYLDRLVHNLNFYRSRLRSGQKLMVMVKAFAYGSGSEEVARVLQFHGVDYLAVAYADEGVALRKAGVDMPIMVLNTESEALLEMLEYELEPEVYSLMRLREVAELANSEQRKLKIHLKLETGMNRLGFEAEQLEDLIGILKSNPLLELSSIFSHLAASDDPEESEFTKAQIQTFQKMAGQIEAAFDYPILKHLANTGAIEDYPEAYFDMVRLGIGLYGVAAHPEEQAQLRQVSELKATVSQVKKVPKGQTVGYGRTWTADRDTRIAVVSIGYADGFPRSLSNGRGQVMIGTKLYPVVGRVCMDMIMVDLGDDLIKEGEEVLIFGESYPIQNMASAMNTIAYEVLTGISSRVKRVYYMA